MRQKRGNCVDTLKRVAEHPLFAGVDESAMAKFLATAEELRVLQEETIYTPRRFRRCLGVLLVGRVRVSKEALVVSILSAGDLFGAAALFSDTDCYATTLTALQDCNLILFPQMAVAMLLRESSRFAENYVRYLSGRIQFLSARLDAVTAGTAEQKLRQFLLSETDADDKLTLSATQLSQRLNIGRASLYRAFEILEGEGVIERNGKEIRILDREKLGG